MSSNAAAPDGTGSSDTTSALCPWACRSSIRWKLCRVSGRRSIQS
jgi:hypothetical protein